MKINQIIQAAVPGASENFCDFIMWERTPFPCGNMSAKQIYKAASRFNRASENGVQLCDLCDNKVDSGYTCNSCEKALDRCRQSR